MSYALVGQQATAIKGLYNLNFITLFLTTLVMCNTWCNAFDIHHF